MTRDPRRSRIAILGGGNLGQALALGWTRHGGFATEDIVVTRRRPEQALELEGSGIEVTSDNRSAIEDADAVILAVQPQQLGRLLEEIRAGVDPERHLVISVASGVSIATLREALPPGAPVVRAMPNTGVSLGASMTCLSAEVEDEALDRARELFEGLGATLVIPEQMMTPATALCACGVAFFLRCIRAASQGGIEIGFHPEEALLLAAQTAHGAAALLMAGKGHPEREIDRVTTPRGCTIAGLNEMEHRGLSSALIRGIVVSARKAEGLAD